MACLEVYPSGIAMLLPSADMVMKLLSRLLQ